MQHLMKNVRISNLGALGPLKGSTAKYSKVVDMQGFEGCLFMCVGSSRMMGASTDTPYIRVQGCSATGGTFYSLNATTTPTSAGAWTTGSKANKLLAVDCYKPLSTQRFLRAVQVGSCTGDLPFIAIQYGVRKGGSSDLWKSSTRAGSTLWASNEVKQTLAISSTASGASTK